MRHSRVNERGHDLRVPVWITLVLGAASAVVLTYWGWRALSRGDTEALESPLILSVARQLVEGPRGLYGPFGGGNPLVLIHAPLYYRLAAMVARPLVGVGLDPVTAAMVAGRGLSVLGLLATVGMAYRLARLDGASRKAGWWTVLLILSAPILSGFPFAVRPDLVGIALQTAGILLVLSALQADRPGPVGLLSAYSAFGLAVCVKQHDVGAAAISTGLLLAAWLRGRLPFRSIVACLAIATAIVLVVYGLEEFATNGRMSQAVFMAAANVGRTHPGDWYNVEIVAVAGLGRTIALITLLTAAHLAVVRSRIGLGPRVFARAGTVLVALQIGLMALQFALVVVGTIGEPSQDLDKRIMKVGLSTLGMGLVMTMLILPACMMIERRSNRGGRLDLALLAYGAAELVLVIALSRISTGAWANYAIEAAVLLAVLTARALARACEDASSRRLLLLATPAVLVAAILHVEEIEGPRYYERLELAAIFNHVRNPRSEFFFVDRPELNRADGRLDLVYDDWLYPVFESIGLAESRSIWLRRSLTSGSVNVVVTTSDNARVSGINEPLHRLRYVPAMRAGTFFVWVREPRRAD